MGTVQLGEIDGVAAAKVELTVKTRAFTGEEFPSDHRVLVEIHGDRADCYVWDSVADHYVRHHQITGDEYRRIVGEAFMMALASGFKSERSE